MKWIHLTHEYYSCVDNESYEKVSHLLWRHSNKCYARARLPGGRDIFLHSLILGEIPLGMEIDHINRCPWDNRISNLRIVPKWENQRNKGIPLYAPLPTEQEKFDAKNQRSLLKANKEISKQKRADRITRPVGDDLGNVYSSCAEAAIALGVKTGSNIAQSARGNRVEAYGRKWKYL
jgi:hypothetical protein